MSNYYGYFKDEQGNIYVLAIPPGGKLYIGGTAVLTYNGTDLVPLRNIQMESSEIVKNYRIAKLPRGWISPDNIVSFNDALTTGIYDVRGGTADGPIVDPYGYLDVQVANGDTWNKSSNWIWQTFYQTGGIIWQRAAINNSSFTNWMRIYRETVLYDNPSGSSGTITLLYNSANFSYIDIEYRIKDDVRLQSKETNRIPIDANVNNNLHDYYVGSTYTYMYNEYININQFVLTVHTNRRITQADNSRLCEDVNMVLITKVREYN